MVILVKKRFNKSRILLVVFLGCLLITSITTYSLTYSEITTSTDSTTSLSGVSNNTITMVKAFQQKYGLPVTGKFRYSDWLVLQDAYNKILKSFPDEYKNYVDELYPDYFLVRGMSGKDVRRLQKFLLAICRYDKSIPGVRVNGVFDELTENSVKKLQQDYGFDINGIVGPLLWKKVVELSKR